MWHWVDFLYLTKWSFILLQIFIVFLTAIFFACKNLSSLLLHKKILLITAHPDDEVMFFAPFLQYFQTARISLLCLSTGNSAGLGRIREKELSMACKYLKINEFEIMDNEKFPDGMGVDWDTEELAKVILKRIKEVGAEAVVTFDGYGVSGHSNHVCVRRAAGLVKEKFKEEVNGIQFWELESTGIIRKYLGVLDIVFSSWNEFAAFNPNPVSVWKGMAIHQSQFVWYRKLFVVFSRYGYVNTFKQF